MGDLGTIVSFSIFECKSAEMTMTLAGMLSENQKIYVAEDR